MDTLEREAYINVALRYSWMLSIIQGISGDYRRDHIKYNLRQWTDSDVEHTVFSLYGDLKIEIRHKMNARREAYERRRELHMEQKTADKKFYQFVQATGYTIDVDPIKLPIRRLIKIYSVYFQDLEKMKRDLDKKGQSPYIG